jgi:hypothetical protein
MKILKNIAQNRDFNAVASLKPDERISNAVSIVEQHFFIPEMVIEIAKLLMTRYLIFSEEDLEFWEDDPESFVQEEETDHWEYHLRVLIRFYCRVVLKNSLWCLFPRIETFYAHL